MEYKLPKLDLNDPLGWISHLDLIMRLKDLRSEETCFIAAAACLQEESLQMQELIARVKGEKCETPYTRLRKLLLDLLMVRKRDRILYGLQMGNVEDLEMKPSAFLATLSHLWMDVTKHDILKAVFLRQLPPKLVDVITKRRVSLRSMAWQCDTYFGCF